MDSSRVGTSAFCNTEIVKWDGVSDVSEVIENHGVVYYDRRPDEWPIDWDVLRSSLDNRRRAFDTAFVQNAITERQWSAVDGVVFELERIIRAMAPGFYFECEYKRNAQLRPMQTGPEPLHLDTWSDGGRFPVAALMNFDRFARVWDVSHTLPEMMKSHGGVIDAMSRAGGLETRLRAATMQNKGPVPDNGPAHRCEFAPGAAWFCNTKTVSHAIRRGGGAVIHKVFVHNRRGGGSLWQK